jgi:hypothetical protein
MNGPDEREFAALCFVGAIAFIPAVIVALVAVVYMLLVA